MNNSPLNPSPVKQDRRRSIGGRGARPRIPAACALLLLVALAARCLAVSPAAPPAARGAAGAPVPPTAATPPGTPRASDPTLSEAESAGEPLAMVVGHSMLINTESRLHRVYVSNPLVLDSYTANPRQLVITAKASGASSLVLWDETGRFQAYLVVASLDIASLRDAMVRAFPEQAIAVAADKDNVSLSGNVRDQATIDAAVKMAAVYTKNVVNALLLTPSHPSQVRLKVRIVEIDRSKEDQFGLNFFAGGSNPGGVTTGQFPVSTSVTGGTSTTGLTISDPLNLFFYNNSLNVGVTIKDLESRRILQILAEPTITTLSGEKGSFLSGGEFPFPVVEGGGGAGTLASVTIQFRPYGVKLDFTPTVNADGTILLKVAPEVSALDYTNAVTISGYTIPALSTRRAETVVELRDGQSFAISGLLDHRTTDVLNKVPVAGNLPVIGALFRSKDISHSVVELVVIVTPTVVDPLSTAPGTDQGEPPTPKFAIPLLDDPEFDQKLRGAVKPFSPDAQPPAQLK